MLNHICIFQYVQTLFHCQYNDIPQKQKSIPERIRSVHTFFKLLFLDDAKLSLSSV